MGLVEIHLSRVIVEQRPENGVTETIVVSVGEVVGKVDGIALVFIQQGGVDLFSIFSGDLNVRRQQWSGSRSSSSAHILTGPSYPRERHGLLASRQGGDETTRRHLCMTIVSAQRKAACSLFAYLVGVFARRILLDGHR
jgi:hypothetical protein